jgi:hypothetical protein
VGVNIVREEKTLLTSDDVNIKMVPLIPWLRLHKLQDIIPTSRSISIKGVFDIFMGTRVLGTHTFSLFPTHSPFS